MEWGEVQSNWDEMKDKIQNRWEKLTDEDLKAIAGRRDQLTDKLAETYGITKGEADRRVDAFCAQCTP